MSALLLIHRDADGRVTNIPFVYKDGHMMEIVEEIASVICAVAGPASLWEEVANERLGTILRLQGELRERDRRIRDLECAYAVAQ